jgi:hypothetical protein
VARDGGRRARNTFLTKASLRPAAAAAIVGLALIPLALLLGPRFGDPSTFVGAARFHCSQASLLATHARPLGAAIEGVAGNWLHLRGDILD